MECTFMYRKAWLLQRVPLGQLTKNPRLESFFFQENMALRTALTTVFQQHKTLIEYGWYLVHERRKSAGGRARSTRVG